ncbi:enterochelin esterase [Chitinophaga costaii]|uniref:Enterochelin esterase n=1 Tax=Chitinophaga costaii TaxID=1335309 RepID=A0A1C4FUK3_9BACT|nr:esterase [Chitinophaga costaii]PUZ27205.1 esterase [Chitinophaga costaii]SCC59333.1 enterochelin esterase [Chitinophaga costaii]
MKLNLPSLALCSLLLLWNAVDAFAQSNNTYSTKGWFGPPPPPFSPVVAPDRHITFRLKAPQASSVQLVFGEWDLRPQAMQRDTAGTWQLTIDPVAPGIYAYNFLVNGVQMPDMNNPETKSGTQLYASIVQVPGNRPRFDERQQVPHGILQTLHYQSTALQRLRGLRVYLPPGYFEQPARRYPVLYLRHGGGDDENSWTQPAGSADVILENLIASNKAVPMIIVMTNGLIDGTWAGGSSPEGVKALQQELLTDVIPLVEKTYHTLPGRDNRAIAGLSMGGGQSMLIGLRNLDRFAWIGEFSSGLLSDKDFKIDEAWPGIVNSSLNEKLHLLWIGCGTKDPRIPGHQDLVHALSQRGVRYEYVTVTGGHEWYVWRVELKGLLEKLFKTPVVYDQAVQLRDEQ